MEEQDEKLDLETWDILKGAGELAEAEAKEDLGILLDDELATDADFILY